MKPWLLPEVLIDAAIFLHSHASPLNLVTVSCLALRMVAQRDPRAVPPESAHMHRSKMASAIMHLGLAGQSILAQCSKRTLTCLQQSSRGPNVAMSALASATDFGSLLSNPFGKCRSLS